MNNRHFSYLEKEAALPCASGSRYKDDFQLVTEGNNMTLKKVGRTDTQKVIQSYRDAVDLGKMIERYKRGDQDAFTRGSRGFYADVSGMTTDLAESIENNRLAAEYMAAAQNAAKADDQNAAKADDQNAAKADQNAAASKEV